MPAMRIELRLGVRFQHFSTGAQRIVMGKGGGCNLRVPLAFLQDQHLEIEHQPGVLRIRTPDPAARAYVGADPLTDEWRLLGADTDVEIPSPEGVPMVVTLEVDRETADAQVAIDEAVGDLAVFTGPMMASPEGEIRDAQELPAPPPQPPLPAVRPPSDRPHRLRNWTILLLLAAAVCAGGAMIWNDYHRALTAKALRSEMQNCLALLDRAQAEMAVGKYASARTTLLEAQRLAAEHQWLEQQDQVAALLHRPEIQYGAIGYQLIDAKWVEPSVANLWLEMKQKNDPRISQLYQQAQTALAEGRYAEAKIACTEAIALMDQFPEPAKPHPLLASVQKMEHQANLQAVAGEMLAKGMVLYKDRWMTPQEKFRIQQQEKGLVEYKGQWLSKDEAFAAEQKDKGLVLFNGQWMSPEDKLRAEGFVEFEGKWMTRQQQEAILAQRQAQKKEADQLAALRKGTADEATKLQRLAYEKSQEFFRAKLSPGAVAQFPAYPDQSITVALSDGWYIVRAPAQVTSSTGEVTKRDYLCQLRPANMGNPGGAGGASGNAGKPAGDWECAVVGWAPAQ